MDPQQTPQALHKIHLETSEVLTGPYKKTTPVYDKLRYLVISDVHLGNQKNPAANILTNLREYFDNFSDDGQFTRLDILFIAGDLFDKALWFHGEDINNIIGFFLDLFSYCEKHQIAFRYLEGTPSHDRGQFKNFVPIAKRFSRLDFKYITEMCVEAFRLYGITCLYVPDEHAGGGKKSQELIAKKLEELEIEQVDIAMVHSWFTFQLPEIASVTKYEETFFLKCVRIFTSCAHVHTPANFERIIGQGSFDRTAHGEEHAKGGVLFEINKDEAYFFPVENKRALPFRTLHVKTGDIDKAIEQIDALASKMVEGSWLRIRAKENNPILYSLEELGRRHQHIRFEKITEEEEKRKKQSALIDQKAFEAMDYESINILKENVVDLIIRELEASGIDSSDKLLLKPLLEAVL